MPGLSSALKGPCPRGSGELAHTLCPAPVSALHLTPPERERDRGEKSGVPKKKEKKKQKVRRRRTKPMKRKANEQECKDDKGGERGRRCFESAA